MQEEIRRIAPLPRRGHIAAALVLVVIVLWSFTARGQTVSGEVIFTVGETELLRGTEQGPVSTGARILEGDRLETGDDSHIHLRMVDGAVISLRSNSALSIEAYRFKPMTPEASKATLILHHGVVRSISGEIGARSKERFRMNTPVAAIGIRGTDFSVLADEQLSRLSVREGGVVMAPFSNDCARRGIGPCEVPGAAELFAPREGAFLEVRLGEARARITRGGVAPDDYAPPHPREADLQKIPNPANDTAGNGTPLPRSLPGAESYEEAVEQAERYMSQSGLISEAIERGDAASEIQPRDRGLVASPNIEWGRYSQYASSSSLPINQLRYAYPDIASTNSDVFRMQRRLNPDRQFPGGGKVHFNLNRYEAYVKRRSELETAAISHPGLVVDFDRQRFAATLKLHADSLSGAVPIVGGGDLYPSGRLASDGESPSQFSGALTDAAGEAGLLFEYQIEPGVDAIGATHWVKDRD